MAVLADPDRFDVWADFMRSSGVLGVITKAELRAAINAADDWANTNSAAYNLALPQPARAVLTAPQKALILGMVVNKRYIKGV